MTKLIINPGVCGFTASVTAHSDDQIDVTLQVDTACPAVHAMMDALGDTFDAFELCLTQPGTNLLYQYAARHFPGHGSCPVIAGITKCVEAECRLALKRNVTFTFVEE